MSERKLELQGLTDPELVSRLQNVERFSKLTLALARTNAVLGSVLMVFQPNHIAAGIFVGATLIAYMLLDGKNHRIETDLKNELRIKEAGDFAPLLFPEILT